MNRSHPFAEANRACAMRDARLAITKLVTARGSLDIGVHFEPSLAQVLAALRAIDAADVLLQQVQVYLSRANDLETMGERLASRDDDTEPMLPIDVEGR